MNAVIPTSSGDGSVAQTATADLADDAVIVDVREPDEWALGHAPGAIHIPLGDLPLRLADLPSGESTPIVVTCRGGGRSTRAVTWLTEQGFNASNLTGGMMGWQSAGRPLIGDGEGPGSVQ